VTGHGNGMYLVDAQGAPTSSGINSTDTRASEYVRRWYANGTAERLLPRICQSVWPAQPVALLAWFRDHRPEVLERTRWVFMCKDFYEEQRVELALAYAVSVHKSRGCEFPAAIVPVLTQHYLLLQRNLIYTAVTRGKRLAWSCWWAPARPRR
jgi:hypothetical protein